MAGSDDRGRVAKATPFSSRTCMRLSIFALCTTSSGSSAHSNADPSEFALILFLDYVMQMFCTLLPQYYCVADDEQVISGYIRICKGVSIQYRSSGAPLRKDSRICRCKTKLSATQQASSRWLGYYHIGLYDDSMEKGVGLTSLMSTKHTMSWSSVLAVKVVGSVPSGAATTGADRIFREASVCRVQHIAESGQTVSAKVKHQEANTCMPVLVKMWASSANCSDEHIRTTRLHHFLGFTR